MSAYVPILSFPSDEESLKIASSELGALSRVWEEKKKELEQTGEYKAFTIKMQREWAIETGIIERLYTWDRGVTELLIEQGIESSLIAHKGGVNVEKAIRIKSMIEDHYHVVEGLFEYVKGEQPMSEYFIRSLHAQFTENQDETEAITPDGRIVMVKLTKGAYKDHPNNPRRPDGEMHYYCPPELVRDEMEKLVRIYLDNEKTSSPEIMSAWLHHSFTQIHPFQDGNGRVARALASLVFLRKGLFPLVIRERDREEYISALEKADAGDLSYLVSLFAKRQRDSILSALGIQQQVQQSKHAEQIITSGIKALREKYAPDHLRHSNVLATADRIQSFIADRIKIIESEFNTDLPSITPVGKPSFYASVSEAKNGDDTSYYFARQIIDVAKDFNYYANRDTYRSWVKLGIMTEHLFEVVFSVHGYGHVSNGIMAVSAFSSERIKGENDAIDVVNTSAACTDLFQFNYAESSEDTLKRFEDWLEGTIAIALAQWYESIS